MMQWCCNQRKKLFKFENGSLVSAASIQEAIEKLKKSKEIIRTPDSDSIYYEFESGLKISSPTMRDAYWHMYMDKRDPVITSCLGVLR
jgi:hypothetical protein